jgi:WS/DGAT/MGAT family acyltransferase
MDAHFVRASWPSAPLHIGTLMIFNPPRGAGRLFVHDLEARLRSHPVRRPPYCYRLGSRSAVKSRISPAWEPLAHVDLSHHLFRNALPTPGGQRELGELVSRLHSLPLDMARPLWEYHLIEGLADGRFGVYIKCHHSVFDGVGGMRSVLTSLSEDPAARNLPPFWAATAGDDDAEPASRAADASSQTLLERLTRIPDLVRRLGGIASEIARLGADSVRAARSPKSSLAVPFAGGQTIFNVLVTRERRVATQRIDLNRVKTLRRATGTSVNDVLLCICGGALRRYLAELDALPKRSLTVNVPVALPRSPNQSGNAIALIVATLCTDIVDPLERLRNIHASTEAAKAQLGTLSPGALAIYMALQVYTTFFALPALLLASNKRGSRSRSVPQVGTVTVSNVVGPRKVQYLDGARLEEFYPISLVCHGQALNITCMSYTDDLCIGIVGCADAAPHLQRMAGYLGEEFENIERAAISRTAVGVGGARRSARSDDTRRASRH